MNLVEIKDIRVGQIYNYHNILYLIKDKLKDDEFITTSYYSKHSLENTVYYEEFATHCKDSILFKSCTLIGKLGITHRIEDGKPVEIPRTAEFQIDDVCYTLSFYNTASPHFDIGVDFEDIIFVIDNMDTYENGTLLLFDARGNEYRPDDVEKIGILGVTHEFVNDREA